jgi:hypothetical protein
VILTGARLNVQARMGIEAVRPDSWDRMLYDYNKD